MADTLVLACRVADYNAATGECAAPFYTYPPGAFPELSVDEGFQLAVAIVGVWTLGLVARLLIRAGQQGQQR